MSLDAAAIVVNYRQAALAARCVESLRRAFDAENLRGQIVLVDCGSGPDERKALQSIEADPVLLEDNRGYSGGVNAGLSKARAARLLLSNADVEFSAGSITPLLRSLDDPRVGAAAPVCAWDAGDRLLLPPGFDPGFLEELSLLRAGGSPARDDRRFAAFARDAVRLWTRGGAARHLSGAVLAARREAFDRVGRFDERFTFEYEETEWERRVRGEGLRLEVVASSRVRHAWGARGAASADSVESAETEGRRRESRRRYRQERFGRLGRVLLERSERRPAPAAPAFPPPGSAPLDPASLRSWNLPAQPGSWALPAQPGLWLALSPHRSRVPFIGADLARPFTVPPEVEPALAAGGWTATVFSAADGRPVETTFRENARPA